MNELFIARSIIEKGLSFLYSVNVWDGEGWAIVRSRNLDKIMDALRSTDEDTVHFRDMDGNHVGWVYFTWGEGEDVVCDHSSN